MKCKVLMAALVITLLMGVRGFASPCDQACTDPCAACNQHAKSGLFSGLKKLVNGGCLSDCGPCDGVVACNPCDDAAACNPCDEVGCNDGCLPRIELGKRLRNLFASHACSPCDEAGNCNPCDEVNDCDPCGNLACDDNCFAPKFSLRNLFKGISLRGCCDSDCGPCDPCGDGNCGPCDNLAACNPCDDVCGNGCDGCNAYCGPRGHLFDLPRVTLKKLFNGFRLAQCDTGCNPCDEVRPCDNTCIR